MTAKMTITLARQARCAALGFSLGPIDGIDGRRTRAAFEAALASQRAKGLRLNICPESGEFTATGPAVDMSRTARTSTPITF